MRAARMWLVCIGALAAAIAVAACGGDDDGDGGSADGAKPKVLVLVPSVESESYIRMMKGAEQEAAEHEDVEIDIQAGRSRGESTNLVAKVETALTQDVDVIAVNAGAVGEQLVPVLNRAIGEGVKVLTFDQDITEIDREGFVSIDVAEAGKRVGRYMGESLPDGGAIGMLQCFADNPVMKQRDEGFVAGLEETEAKIDIVSRLDAECDVEKARTNTENLLSAHPDIDGVFSNTDLELTGAVPALERAQADPVVVGFDGDVPIIKQIAAGGTVDATVTNPFEEYGVLAVRNAAELARGESVPEFIEIPSELVTEENAADVLSTIESYDQ